MAAYLAAACLAAACLAAPPPAAADEVSRAAPKPSVEEQIMFRLRQVAPRMDITGVSPSEIDGIFQVSLRDNRPLYTTAQGRYVLQGSLYRIDPEGLVNVWVIDQLDAVASNEAISFSPATEPRATVTVFTDVDCGYCRRFHAQMAEMNRKGVRVNYLAFPRNGLGSEGHQKMVSAWCSADRRAALTNLKMGRYIEERRCASNPVSDQYELGLRIGVTGTPAVYDEQGSQLGGYLSTADLLKSLGIDP